MGDSETSMVVTVGIFSAEFLDPATRGDLCHCRKVLLSNKSRFDLASLSICCIISSLFLCRYSVLLGDQSCCTLMFVVDVLSFY